MYIQCVYSILYFTFSASITVFELFSVRVMVLNHSHLFLSMGARLSMCHPEIKEGSQLGNIPLRFKHNLYHVLRDFVRFPRVSRFYIYIYYSFKICQQSLSPYGSLSKNSNLTGKNIIFSKVPSSQWTQLPVFYSRSELPFWKIIFIFIVIGATSKTFLHRACVKCLSYLIKPR